MDKFQESKQSAIKHIRAADHILTQTYPHLKDPKLLLAAVSNIYQGMDDTLNAFLFYYKSLKLVPAFHDSVPAKVDLLLRANKEFKKELALSIKSLHELIQTHKDSSVEFSKKDSFFITRDDYNLKKINLEIVKKYLNDAKILATQMERTLK